MGAARAITPEGKNKAWQTCARSSATPEWDFVGAEDRRALARYAGTIWEIDTIYSRFQRWRKSAVWDKMFAELQTALDVESNLDWEIHFIDSTIVRAHQHAAGAKKVAQNKRL